MGEDLLLVGIDCGVNTGIATGRNRQLLTVESMTITQAMDRVKELVQREEGNVRVYIEDARLRKGGFSKADEQTEKYGAAVREGAGSVKRDCSIWETFCKEQGISFKLVHPKHIITKLPADKFFRFTRWPGVTNEHSRDAAMIIFNKSGRELG